MSVRAILPGMTWGGIVLLALALAACNNGGGGDDDDDDGGADTVAPSITAVVTPDANAAGWHNSDVTVEFQCTDADSGIASCPDPVTVDSEGADQAVSGTAVDNAGNSADVTVTVSLDTTPPALSGFVPAAGTTVPRPGVNLTGTVTDALAGIAAVTCTDDEGSDEAALNEGDEPDEFIFGCSLPLDRGQNAVSVAATDVADNETTADLNMRHLPLPAVSIETPADRSLVEASPLIVTGTLDDATDSVAVNGVTATIVGDQFEAAVPLDSGVHTITAVGRNAAGFSSVTARVVAVIGQPRNPTVHIAIPEDDFVMGGEVGEADTVAINGWVRDNRDLPGGAPTVSVTYDEISPDDGTVLNSTTVDAVVSPGPHALCWWDDVCWRFDSELPVTSTDGFRLEVRADAATADLDGAVQRTGVFDLCYQNNGDDNASGACDASLVQRPGCTQSRRCIENAMGCPDGLGNNPTNGTLGVASTAFGSNENPATPGGAFTVFGQPRTSTLPCNRHNECYSQWCPTDGPNYAGVVAEKQSCNERFRDELAAVCQAAYPEFSCPEGRIGAANCDRWSEEKNLCFTWARKVVEFVTEDADRYLVAGPHYDAWPYGGFLTPVAGCPAIQ